MFVPSAVTPHSFNGENLKLMLPQSDCSGATADTRQYRVGKKKVQMKVKMLKS